MFWAFEKATSLVRAAVVAAHRRAYVHLLGASTVLGCVSGERSSVYGPCGIWTCRHFVRTYRTPGTGLIRLLPDETFLGFRPSGKAQEIERESRWWQETRPAISESKAHIDQVPVSSMSST